MKTILDYKNLHTIWIGDESKTPYRNIDTWKAKHPDWKFKLWGNKELKEYKWERQDIIDEYLKYNNYPAVADVMRYQILKDIGGFVAPADSICLHNLEELLNHKAIGVYENEKVRKGLISPLMASVPNHELPTALLDNMQMKYDPHNKPLRPVWVTGNYYMRDMIKARHWDDLVILPSYTLIPIHFTGETYKGNEKVYAMQTWGDTTKRGKGIGSYTINPKWLTDHV